VSPVAGPGTQVGVTSSGDNWLRTLLTGGSGLGGAGDSTPGGNWLWAFVQPTEATPAAVPETSRGEKYTVLRQLITNESWQVTEPGAEETAPLSTRRWAQVKRHDNLEQPYQNMPMRPSPSALFQLDLFTSRA
jgi:hypothetical protein